MKQAKFKLLVLISLLFLGGKNVIAKETTFEDISAKMKEAESEISSKCYKSVVDVTKDSVVVSFTIKDETEDCDSFENYLDKWKLTFFDHEYYVDMTDNETIGFTDSRAQEFTYENVDTEIVELKNKWTEKMFNVIKELNNLEYTIDILHDTDCKLLHNLYDYNVVTYEITLSEPIMLTSAQVNSYYFNLRMKYRDIEYFRVVDVTSNSVTLAFTPYASSCEFLFYRLYKYNPDTKMYELLGETLDNKTLKDENLKPNTTYKYLEIEEGNKESLSEEEVTELLKKEGNYSLEVTTLKDTTSLNGNPQTGEMIPYIVIAVVLLVGITTYVIIRRKNKIHNL